MTRRSFARAILYWPSVLLVRVGLTLVSAAGTGTGRFTVRPFFRLFCRFALYARPLRFPRGEAPCDLRASGLYRGRASGEESRRDARQ